MASETEIRDALETMGAPDATELLERRRRLREVLDSTALIRIGALSAWYTLVEAAFEAGLDTSTWDPGDWGAFAAMFVQIGMEVDAAASPAVRSDHVVPSDA